MRLNLETGCFFTVSADADLQRAQFINCVMTNAVLSNCKNVDNAIFTNCINYVRASLANAPSSSPMQLDDVESDDESDTSTTPSPTTRKRGNGGTENGSDPKQQKTGKK